MTDMSYLNANLLNSTSQVAAHYAAGRRCDAGPCSGSLRARFQHTPSSVRLRISYTSRTVCTYLGTDGSKTHRAAERRGLPSCPNSTWPNSRLFLCRSDHDASIGDAAFFAALQIDGAGQFLITVERTTRDAGNFLLVDDGLAVLHDRYGSAD